MLARVLPEFSYGSYHILYTDSNGYYFIANGVVLLTELFTKYDASRPEPPDSVTHHQRFLNFVLIHNFFISFCSPHLCDSSTHNFIANRAFLIELFINYYTSRPTPALYGKSCDYPYCELLSNRRK
jgi:hypothetical protein